MKVTYAVYEVLILALVVNFSRPELSKTRASIPAIALTLAGYLIIPILSYAEHVKTIQPSVILNGYLLLSLVFDSVHVRTLWLRYNGKISGDFTASIAVKAVILLLEAIEKRRILRPEFRVNSPEATSGVYNRSFFWWLNGLFRLGWRKTLYIPDLFSLDKHLNSKYLQRLFESSWLKG